MFIFDFKNKLAKVNPLLYIYDNNANENFGHQRVSGIYLRNGRRSGGLTRFEQNEVSAEVRNAIETKSSGQCDTFCGGCNLNELSEFDEFDLEYDRMINMGWRSTLIMLANRGFIDLNKARKVFNCPSLGESDYDKLDFFGKLAYAHKLARK